MADVNGFCNFVNFYFVEMLLDRIESEDIDDQEKRERIKKFYNYVNMKIFNSTKKKSTFFRRSVSESGYL